MLNGNDGNDTLIGGEGGDMLNGGAGRDTLIGGESGDDLHGGAGDDVMQGGTGNDAYYVDSIEDVVLEYAGEGFADGVYTTISLTLGQNVELLVAASDAGLTLTGNSLDNIIGGGGGNDVLNGGDGDDTLFGKAGSDVMQGGAGNDTYFVEDNGETVTELANQGTDTVHTLLSFTLGRHVENLFGHSDSGLTLIGNGLANVITGDGGNDALAGAQRRRHAQRRRRQRHAQRRHRRRRHGRRRRRRPLLHRQRRRHGNQLERSRLDLHHGRPFARCGLRAAPSPGRTRASSSPATAWTT